jgi:hypothetical protein
VAETVILRDGAAILIRPIESADRPLLETAFSELSTESRHRRFLSPMRRLSTAQLEYLTNVDHRNHEALVALDEPADRMIGVARLVRTGPERRRAGGRRRR